MDWLGGGAVSARETAERIITETLRRVRLLAQNDPTVVPPSNDLSVILSARSFVLQPPIPQTPPDTLSPIIAARIFLRGTTVSATALQLLTFGAHLTGGSYDGSAPVTLGTDAVATNTPSTMVARDGAGSFAANIITASLSGNATTSSSTTGNAATATKLATARAINGVNFDGTAPITVTADAGTLTGATLAAGVTGSSLTTVGTLSSLKVGAGATLDQPSTGGNPTAGTAALVAGTATVATTAISANHIVVYNRATVGGTLGNLSYTRINGTSITFNSDQAADTSSIDWHLIKTH